jgi:hypothetical protein
MTTKGVQYPIAFIGGTYNYTISRNSRCYYMFLSNTECIWYEVDDTDGTVQLHRTTYDEGYDVATYWVPEYRQIPINVFLANIL